MNGRSMRRKDRQLPREEGLRLLAEGEYGVLAMAGPEEGPYGVPLSYVYLEGKIYFHSAREGRKASMLRADARVCFTVTGHVRAAYQRNFTTAYESVMAFGRAAEVTDPEEKRTALFALAGKYLPEYLNKADGHIRASLENTAVYVITVSELTAKGRTIDEKSIGTSQKPTD